MAPNCKINCLYLLKETGKLITCNYNLVNRTIAVQRVLVDSMILDIRSRVYASVET